MVADEGWPSTTPQGSARRVVGSGAVRFGRGRLTWPVATL